MIQFSSRVVHVRRVPLELAPARQQRLAVIHRLDEPLTARDDLERAIALLVELDRVRDRSRVAEQVAALAQQLDDAGARLRSGQAGQLIVVAAARAAGSVASQPGSPHATALKAPFAWMMARTGNFSSRHQTTSVTSPNVQIIADAAALFRIGERVRLYGYPHAEQRRHDLGPKSG